jgi:hypothetical protein
MQVVSPDDDDASSVTVHGLDPSTDYWFTVSASRSLDDEPEADATGDTDEPSGAGGDGSSSSSQRGGSDSGSGVVEYLYSPTVRTTTLPAVILETTTRNGK